MALIPCTQLLGIAPSLERMAGRPAVATGREDGAAPTDTTSRPPRLGTRKSRQTGDKNLEDRLQCRCAFNCDWPATRLLNQKFHPINEIWRAIELPAKNLLVCVCWRALTELLVIFLYVSWRAAFATEWQLNAPHPTQGHRAIIATGCRASYLNQTW